MAGRWSERGKRLLESLLYLIPRGPAPVLPVTPEAIRRVLVVRPDERIGNLILLTPALAALRRAWPGVSVDLVAGGAMASLFRGDPRIDEIVVFDKRALVRNPFGLVSLARRLRRGHYDLAIDASHSHQFSLTSALLTRVSGARYRLGYLRGPGRRLLNAGLEPDRASRRHTADLYVDLLKVMIPTAAGGGLDFPLLPGEAARAERLLENLGVPRALVRIGFHPGGRGGKRWPAGNFAELARRLHGGGRRVLLFYGPGEEHLVDQFPAEFVTIVPRLSLRDLAAAIKCCDLFVSSDTGPMHLAAAVGVPTLAIFTRANSDMFGPRGPEDRVLEEPGGPGVDRVHEIVKTMLARRFGANSGTDDQQVLSHTVRRGKGPVSNAEAPEQP